MVSAVKVFDGVAGVALGDVLLTLWRAPARVQRVRRVASWATELLEVTPQSIAACQFLLPSASPPDRAARAEAKAALRVVAPRARRLVTVPLGDAAWRSVVRAIIRVALVLARKSKMVKIAATEAEAFALLAQVATPLTPSHAELAAGLDALRGALDLDDAKLARP